MNTFLSAALECWNCPNSAPTHDNGMFKFLAVEPSVTPFPFGSPDELSSEIHAICEECFIKDEMELPGGKVLVASQDADGMATITE